MGNSASHFSQLDSDKQEPNGVTAGFTGGQLTDFLGVAINTWEQRTRMDGVLLQALLKLSAIQPDQAPDGFTAMDLADEMGKILGRGWSKTDTSEVIANKVRKQWKRLTEELWPQKQEGLIQLAADQGMDWLPQLDRVEGGGSGRPTRYRIVTTPISKTPDQSIPSIADPLPGEIRYICEDLTDAGFITRWFSRGYVVTGWRRWLLLLMYIVTTLVAIVAILWLFKVLQLPPSSRDALSWLIIYTGATWVAWETVMRVLVLPDVRIGMAPWWIQLGESNRLLEWRCPPRHPEKSIKASRYTATCPLCKGKVVVKSGGIQHWGRLVGRCEEAPSEHVFSFDHVLRRGHPLNDTTIPPPH